MIDFFKVTIFIPLYNLLVLITSVLPGADLGLAIIILTILIKLVIFPLYATSVKTQLKMKLIEPRLREIKEKYKKDIPEQSRQIMEIYQKEKIKPFSGILVMFIQLPIIISLYYVFKDSLTIRSDILYSFITVTEQINTTFLGLIDLTANKNIYLAILTGVTLYIQVRISLSAQKKGLLAKTNKADKKGPNFAEDFAKSMDLQMRYVMPVMTSVFSFTLPAAIAVYWITSNIFSAIYEYFVISKIRQEGASKTPLE